MKSIFDLCKIQIDGIAYALPVEVSELIKQGAIIVDLRAELETEIKAFGIDRIIYLPHDEFEEKWTSLPTDQPLILADSVGIWSKRFAIFLKSKGIENAASLAGGMADWEKDGYPVKPGKYQPLNGPCLCMITPKERK